MVPAYSRRQFLSGAVLCKGMDIGIIPQPCHFIPLCPQNLNALVGAGAQQICNNVFIAFPRLSRLFGFTGRGRVKTRPLRVLDIP